MTFGVGAALVASCATAEDSNIGSSEQTTTSVAAASPDTASPDSSSFDTFDLAEAATSPLDAQRNDAGAFEEATLLAWWAGAVEPIDGIEAMPADMIQAAEPPEMLRGLAALGDATPESVRARLDSITKPSAGAALGFKNTNAAPRQADLTQAQGERLVTELTPVLERWLGEPLGIGLWVTVNNNADVFTRPLTGAMAIVHYLGGVPVGPCVMHVRQTGGPVEGIDQWRRSAILHELYHCYQFRLVADGARTGATPAWIAEGTASYVGEKLSGGSVYGDVWMRTWLESANGNFANRSYDAIGLMWLLDDAGVGLKGRFDQLLQSRPDPDAQLALALGGDVGVADAVRHRWGSHVANQPWGPQWRPPSIARIPSDAHAVPMAFRYTAGGTPALLRSRGTRAGIYQAATSGDLLTVTVAANTYGHLRFADGTTTALTAGEHRYCLTAQACQPCPATGEQPLGAAATPGSEGQMSIGLMTQGDGSATVIGKRWATVCGEEPADTEPPAPDNPDKCAERMPKSEFRRVTGETYENTYESSRDQCLFEDANFKVIIDLDATPLDVPATKAIANLRGTFVDGSDLHYQVVDGWQFAAISPDGTHFIGVFNGKQFFSETRSSRITTRELQALTKFYLGQF